MLSLRAAFHKRLRKGLKQNPMGVSGAGGVAKPGWATTEQPIPGGGSKKPVTPQAKPLPGVTPLGLPTGKHKNMQAAVMKAVRLVAKHKDKRGSTAHHGGHKPKRVGGTDPARSKFAPKKPPFYPAEWEEYERTHPRARQQEDV